MPTRGLYFVMLAVISYINMINAKFDAEIWHVNINKKTAG